MQDDKVQTWGDRLDFLSSTEKLKGLDSEGAALPNKSITPNAWATACISE